MGADKVVPGVFPGGTQMESMAWFRCARLAYTIATRSFDAGKVVAVTDAPGKIDNLRMSLTSSLMRWSPRQLPVIGKTLLDIAFGKITFKNIDYNLASGEQPRDCYGSVLTTAGTASSVPNQPVGINTFVHLHMLDSMTKVQGDRQVPVAYRSVQANPYGEYSHRFTFDMPSSGKLIVSAARFADDGTVTYYDDTSSASEGGIFNTQNILPSDVTFEASKPENVPVFRGCMVECYQRINPKTLNAYAHFDFLTYPGLIEPDMNHIDNNADSPAAVAFLEPDCIFGLAMLDGSAGNPEIQTYRAFALNVSSESGECG